MNRRTEISPLKQMLKPQIRRSMVANLKGTSKYQLHELKSTKNT